MRRAFAAIVLTVVGLYLVLAFKSSPVTRTSLSAPATTTTTAPAAPTDNGGQAPAGPPPPDATTTTASATGGLRTGTFAGSDVQNRYGDVQVQITIAGGKITGVTPLQMPFDRARSQEISDQVAPILSQEVLDAQSANIDTVSGATYTSDSYAQSLQAALDKAHA